MVNNNNNNNNNDKYDYCEQNGHAWEATGCIQVGETTLQVEYECFECGKLQYDYVEGENI